MVWVGGKKGERNEDTKKDGSHKIKRQTVKKINTEKGRNIEIKKIKWMTKQVRRTMGCITFKNGSRVVGKNNENIWGKATYRKESGNIFQLGCQSCF